MFRLVVLPCFDLGLTVPIEIHTVHKNVQPGCFNFTCVCVGAGSNHDGMERGMIHMHMTTSISILDM